MLQARASMYVYDVVSFGECGDAVTACDKFEGLRNFERTRKTNKTAQFDYT